MSNTFSPYSEPMTPGTRLVENLESLGSPSPVVKTGDAVPDDWPKPRTGGDPYGCAGACITPVRLTLPPVPPLSVPLSPAAAWVSGGFAVLSPLRIFSPMLPSFFGMQSPIAPLSASDTESTKRLNVDEASNFSPVLVAEHKLTGKKNKRRSRERVIKSNRGGPAVKLSMPPKIIERRAKPTESGGCSDAIEVCLQQIEGMNALKPTAPTARAKGGVGRVSKPFEFRSCHPAKKELSTSFKERIPDRLVKENQPTANYSEHDRLRYQHVWADQRDAVAELLGDIGFDTTQLAPNKYNCSLCPKLFSSRMFATRHAIRDHLHGKVFGCELCCSRFTRSDTLVRHMKRKHELN